MSTIINVACVRRNGLTCTFQTYSWRDAFTKACEVWARVQVSGEEPVYHVFFSDGENLHHANVIHNLSPVSQLRARFVDVDETISRGTLVTINLGADQEHVGGRWTAIEKRGGDWGLACGNVDAQDLDSADIELWIVERRLVVIQ